MDAAGEKGAELEWGDGLRETVFFVVRSKGRYPRQQKPIPNSVYGKPL